MDAPQLDLVIRNTGEAPRAASSQGGQTPSPAGGVAPSPGANRGANAPGGQGANRGASDRGSEHDAGANEGAIDRAALPSLELAGRPMTTAERAAQLAHHWVEAGRADLMRPGELAHAAWHGKPESLAEVHAYAVSRAWIPEGYDGRLLSASGALYAHTVAKGGTALGLAFIWTVQRPLRLLTALFVCGIIAALIAAFS